ncbi:hypothetical protein PCE1_004642 [Barthelona sp. PCE]
MSKSQIGNIMFTKDEIEARVHELSVEIFEHYVSKGVHEITLVPVLVSSFFFCTDISRNLNRISSDRNVEFQIFIDPIDVSFYGETSTTPSDTPTIRRNVAYSIEDKHILIVEDMIDSGVTLKHAYDILAEKKPASMQIAVVFDKVENHKVDINADYVGFPSPDVWIIGCS